VAFSERIPDEYLGVLSVKPVEDLRVGLIANARGVEAETHEGWKGIKQALEEMQQDDPWLLSTMIIAAYPERSLYKKVSRWLEGTSGKVEWDKNREQAANLAKTVIAAMGEPGPCDCGEKNCGGENHMSFQSSLEIGAWLERFRKVDNQQKKQKQEERVQSSCTFGRKLIPGMQPSPRTNPYSGAVASLSSLPEGDVSDEWGRMIIDEPLRFRNMIPQHKIANNIRSVEYGCVPARIHNAWSNGRVFTQKITSGPKGGTILLDCSGSMELGPREVQGLVNSRPAAQIAGYCAGGDHDTIEFEGFDYSVEVGMLRIFVKNGRAIREDLIKSAFYGGDNGIDGVALGWLAKQPGPRYWVSDEGVSGGGSPYVSPISLKQECRDICKKNRIWILPNIRTLEEVLDMQQELHRIAAMRKGAMVV
jgi:hypothetical protein